jgi:hypothetical protein
VKLATEYYGAGGHDRATWNQICDGLGHEAMGLMMELGGPAHPYVGRQAEEAVTEAAGMRPLHGGMREALHQQLAKGLMAVVLTAGRQMKVGPGDWPQELASVVLGAVRTAPLINQDPMMANLKDPGFPAR